MDGGGVLERDEQAARVLNQAEDGQPARLARQAKGQMSRSPVADRAILAAGVDQKLGPIARLHPRGHAEGWIVREVMKPSERRPLFRLDRRLRMRFEQAIAALAKLLERVRSADPIKVANPSPPVDKVEQPDRV